MSEPLGAKRAAGAKWTCEPRCEYPQQRLSTFVGELSGLKAYTFACVAPCATGKTMDHTETYGDEGTYFHYACVTPKPPLPLAMQSREALNVMATPTRAWPPPPPPPSPPRARTQAEIDEDEASLREGAARAQALRKEHEEDAHSLAWSCNKPCAKHAYACYGNPMATSKMCDVQLEACEKECRQ
jgi:hypothetical protein